MIVQNPKKQTVEEIKKEFRGYCVCIEDIDRDERGRMLRGTVVVFDKHMRDVWEQADTIPEGKYSGIGRFANLTESEDYIYSGVSEVIHV